MEMKELEARIKRLEDIEEIKRLKATYAILCDDGLDKTKNLNEMLSLYTDDATLDFGLGEGSQFYGKDGLKLFFGEVVPGTLSYCMHMVHNAVIDIDDDKAKGRYYFEAPTTDVNTGKAQWMVGTYYEEYARVDDKWKFTSIKVKWDYISPYEDGWGKNRGEWLEGTM
jgi:hypothetical protein